MVAVAVEKNGFGSLLFNDRLFGCPKIIQIEEEKSIKFHYNSPIILIRGRACLQR